MASKRTKVPPRVGNAMVATGLEDPAPGGDVVATIYKDYSAPSAGPKYVEPLPPQSLNCVGAAGMVGCPVERVWYGSANITLSQQADAERKYIYGPDLDRIRMLVVGHLATVTVRNHMAGHDPDPVEQIWFVVKKLYLAPYHGRRIGRHSPQFFYATGTASNAQVLAISRGEQSPRAARITWTGQAILPPGSDGPSIFNDLFVTGEADFTRSPLPIQGDEYFVRQTRTNDPIDESLSELFEMSPT
jgi:hypothetical protein